MSAGGDRSPTTVHLQHCLDRLQAGGKAARQDLLTAACERLTRLTRKMFRDWPRLRYQVETGDVFQNAAIRLYRALEAVSPPTVLDFYRLAALQIRRELIDLGRQIPPPGEGSPPQQESGEKDAARHDHADSTHDPVKLAAWVEFHEKIASLPEMEREVFDLLYYQELTHAEAAELLGVSTKTIQTRWRNARLLVGQMMQSTLPEM